MRNKLLFICLVLSTAGCGNSDSGAGQKPVNASVQEQQTKVGDIQASRSPSGSLSDGKTYEDLKILEGMASQETSLSEKYLDQADKLKYTSYGDGDSMSLAECEAINAKISANYKLHRYEVNSSKGYEIKTGTDLCPNSGFKYGEYIELKSAKITFRQTPIKNLLGVAGTSVLKVSVVSWPSGEFVREIQYVLNSKFKVIEMTVHDDNWKHNLVYNEIAALSAEGHVLGRVEKVRSNMNEEYLWKGASTFIAADGSIEMAMRVYQNDGKGIPAVMTSYTIPYKYQWQSYEVSPLTRLGGFYLVKGKTETWPNSQMALQYVSKSGASCGYGYTGYTDKGAAIREFGDIKCEAKMDVQTSRH